MIILFYFILCMSVYITFYLVLFPHLGGGDIKVYLLYKLNLDLNLGLLFTTGFTILLTTQSYSLTRNATAVPGLQHPPPPMIRGIILYVCLNFGLIIVINLGVQKNDTIC